MIRISAAVLPLLLLLSLPACDGATREAREGVGAQAPGSAPSAGVRPPRGQAWVIFGADTVRAEVAASAEERSRGLMFREELPAGTGMLFVFTDAQPRSFWMRNTYIPLDIAYLDERRRIVDIQAMEPESDEFYPSAAPAMYAVEVPQGWFAEHGIGVGDVAELVMGTR